MIRRLCGRLGFWLLGVARVTAMRCGAVVGGSEVVVVRIYVLVESPSVPSMLAAAGDMYRQARGYPEWDDPVPVGRETRVH